MDKICGKVEKYKVVMIYESNVDWTVRKRCQWKISDAKVMGCGDVINTSQDATFCLWTKCAQVPLNTHSTKLYKQREDCCVEVSVCQCFAMLCQDEVQHSTLKSQNASLHVLQAGNAPWWCPCVNPNFLSPVTLWIWLFWVLHVA